jgi:hypothetical protein
MSRLTNIRRLNMTKRSSGNPFNAPPKAKARYYGDDTPADKARFKAEVAAGKRQGAKNVRDHMQKRSVAPADDKKPVSFGAGAMTRGVVKGKVTDGGYC